MQNFRKAVFLEVTNGLFTFSFLSLLTVHELHGRSWRQKKFIFGLFLFRGKSQNFLFEFLFFISEKLKWGKCTKTNYKNVEKNERKFMKKIMKETGYFKKNLRINLKYLKKNCEKLDGKRW